MEIRTNNNLAFKAKVDSNFIKNTERYCFNRNLPLQHDIFKKSLEKMEFIGSDHSEIVYTAKKEKDGFQHMLCLKNTQLNKKSAAIIAVSKKYSDIMSFFTNITEQKMQAWENYLKTM